MRGSLKLASMVGFTTVLLGSGISPVTTSKASSETDSQVAALQAQRADLAAQLAKIQPSRQSAGASLSSAEDAFSGAQDKVLATAQQLDKDRTQLSDLARQMNDDQQTSAKVKRQLGSLIRMTYEKNNGNGVMSAMLTSGTFNEVMDRFKNESHITDQVVALQKQLSDKAAAIKQEQDQIQSELDQAMTLQQQYQRQSDQMASAVAERNAAFDTVDGPARTLAVQIATIDEQIAQLQAPPVAAGDPGGDGCRHDFSAGQCTAYVAMRRCVTWSGDAWSWYDNAAAQGYAVGHTARVGAIAVMPPGVQGASYVGHVAYVEAVNGDGTFLVTDWNWGGSEPHQLIDDGSIGFIY